MSFVNKKQVPKNIKYVITEIGIVVFGIFIAIQLNNWNENRKNDFEEIKSINLLISDLKKEKRVLERTKKQMHAASTYLSVIFDKNGNDKHLDSLVYYLDTEFIHLKLNSAYINLKYAGKLNSIKNDELKIKLINFYENYYGAFDGMSTSHSAFIYNNLRPYTITKIPVDINQMADEEVVKNKLKDAVFVNLINYQINAFTIISSYLDTKVVDELLILLQKEITYLEK